MTIVIDSKNPNAEATFGHLGTVRLVATTEMSAEAVRDADVVIVRSETKVDRTILEGSKVRFVGTATIGTDHIDLDYLKANNIGFASAPGSNSNSVAEYVVSALLEVSARMGKSLADVSIGIVGVGNVGAKVARYASVLGMQVLQNDPPRARAEGKGSFLSLDDLMEADIISLHVPLTRSGKDATFHLFDDEKLSGMKPGAVLINTSRGPVIDNRALKERLATGVLSGAVLDVWENEPLIDMDLLGKVTLGTPHIAGYSLDGKLNAIRMMYDAVCERFDVPKQEPPPPASTVGHSIGIKGAIQDIQEALHSMVKTCYDIEQDANTMKAALACPESQRGGAFRRLRSEYPVRREFNNTRFILGRGNSSFSALARALGFSIVSGPGTDSDGNKEM